MNITANINEKKICDITEKYIQSLKISKIIPHLIVAVIKTISEQILIFMDIAVIAKHPNEFYKSVMDRCKN